MDLLNRLGGDGCFIASGRSSCGGAGFFFSFFSSLLLLLSTVRFHIFTIDGSNQVAKRTHDYTQARLRGFTHAFIRRIPLTVSRARSGGKWRVKRRHTRPLGRIQPLLCYRWERNASRDKKRIGRRWSAWSTWKTLASPHLPRRPHTNRSQLFFAFQS